MAAVEGILSFAVVAATAIVAPTVFGLGLVRALGLPRGAGVRVQLAYAWLTGQVALAACTAAWLWLGQPWPGLLLPIVALLAGAWLLWRCQPPAATGDALAAPSRTARGLTFAATAAVVLGLVHDGMVVNAEPIRIGDEAEIWAAKAKALHGANDIELGQSLAMVSHADYPNLQPLVQVLAFAGSGRVLHFENRLPVQFFGVALLLLLSAAATRRAHTPVALAALVACSGTLATAGATRAYADTAVAFAALATVDALLRWHETGARVWWRLACLAAAALLASKNEGTMLLLAIALPTAAWSFARTAPERPRPALPRRELGWLLVPAVTWTLHRVFLHTFDLRTDLTDPALAGGRGLATRIVDQAATHGPQVAEYFGRMAIDPAAHRLLPIVFALAATVALASSRRRWLGEGAALLAAIAGSAIAGYALVFVGTHADLGWHLSTAAARTVAHVVPLCALGAAMALAPRGGAGR
ncbi:MAG: hypothetical protein JNK15_14200 [Planctomycetes bacterium]|nr:hypothetical protein [Planctomycetota bacterium]